MAARYVICPIVIQDGIRTPKVGTIHDPGRPLVTDEAGNILSHYVYSCVASDGIATPGQNDLETFCLVGGHNMSALNSDKDIETVVDVPDAMLADIKDVLDQTPNELLNQGQKNKFESFFTDRAIDISSVTFDDPFWIWGSLLCDSITGAPADIRLLTTVLVGEAP